jgi:hypothetical protein
MALHRPVGHGILTVEASLSHSDTPHLLWLPWTSDQPKTETSTWQHTTITTDINIKSIPPLGFEREIAASERPQTHNLDRAATGIGFNAI